MTVVTLADEVLLSIVLRVITNGTTIDVMNSTATTNPQKTEQRQQELVCNEHPFFLSLEIIDIVF